MDFFGSPFRGSECSDLWFA